MKSLVTSGRVISSLHKVENVLFLYLIQRKYSSFYYLSWMEKLQLESSEKY